MPTPPPSSSRRRVLALGAGGRFCLRKVASIGDAGVCFLAADQQNGGRACAVRVPHAWWLRAGGKAEAWTAGWRASARNPHACHVKVVAIDDSPALPFVVHEWVPGVDLATIMRARIADGNILPWRFALAAAWILSDAVYSAQQNALLEGAGETAAGLGPHRLHIGDNGRVVLTARFAPQAALQALPVPANAADYAYRAPEVLQDGAHTPLSDAWSIALFLEHAAAGWNRLERGTVADTAEAILAAPEDTISPFVPEEAAALVAAALCPDPARRAAVTGRWLGELRKLVALAGGMPTADDWAELARQVEGAERSGDIGSPKSRAAVSELVDLIKRTRGPELPVGARSRAPRVLSSLQSGWATRLRAASRNGVAAAATLIVLGGAGIATLSQRAGAGHEPTRTSSSVQVGASERGHTVEVRTPPLAQEPTLSLHGDPGEGGEQWLEVGFVGVTDKPSGELDVLASGTYRSAHFVDRVGGFALVVECAGRCPTPSRFESGLDRALVELRAADERGGQ